MRPKSTFCCLPRLVKLAGHWPEVRAEPMRKAQFSGEFLAPAPAGIETKHQHVFFPKQERSCIRIAQSATSGVMHSGTQHD
jgi:hypothetical protein